MRLVIDTNVLIAAARSHTGASNRLFRRVAAGDFAMLATVALFLEYEAVLTRSEHMHAAGFSAESADGAITYLANMIQPVESHFRWRPQLRDDADEMVLEAAINGGADAIVSFNVRHFAAAVRFGVRVMSPAQVMELIDG